MNKWALVIPMLFCSLAYAKDQKCKRGYTYDPDYGCRQEAKQETCTKTCYRTQCNLIRVGKVFINQCHQVPYSCLGTQLVLRDSKGNVVGRGTCS